ncbi:hypothetical protein V6N13_069434 [Hibiscus sabdariffa]
MDLEMEMATILDASPQQFYVGSSSNQMINTDMELDVGYTIPGMMAPPPPAPAYNPDPAEEYMVIPPEEYIVNPAEGTNINPAEGDNVILQKNDNILDAAPGFEEPYNIIDPEVNDILDVADFGGYNPIANPPGNDNLDSLDMVLKDFKDGYL